MRIVLIVAVLLGFILVHLVKMMRLYLILIDKNVPFERYVPAYLRTTLVNLIIPFKLGEIYRVLVFYRISGEFKTGFLSVLVDRFFDTFAIVLILLPYQLFVSGSLTLPAVILSAFLIVIVFAYIVFFSTYQFLNRYIITHKSSKRSMKALKGLEITYEWYDYVRNLVKGRYGVLILMSLTAWLVELIIISGFARIVGGSFSVSEFGRYIESIISGSTYALKNQYTFVSICLMIVATFISVVYYLIVSRRKSK